MSQRNRSAIGWARAWLEEEGCNKNGVPLLRKWKSEYWNYTGSHFRNTPRDGILDAFAVWIADEGGRPTRNLVSDVLFNVAAQTCIPDHVIEQPHWITDGDQSGKKGDARDWVALHNEIFHVPSWVTGCRNFTRSHSPLWFSPTCLPYPYRARAKCPTWLNFLDQVFQSDLERIELLQEWFGYCITSDTSRQRLMLMEGRPGAGKGTVLRAMESVIGADNCAATRLAHLASQFGLWGLVGKTVAICPDAQVPHDAGSAVLEIIKSIVGEDTQEVHRKMLAPMSCRLKTRFTLAVNELPRFADTTDSMGRRYLILSFLKSFSDKPDHRLSAKLEKEAPGIFLWALEGLRSLLDKDEFTEPKVGVRARVLVGDISSPVKAFIREECIVDPNVHCSVNTLWGFWSKWCEESGHKRMTRIRFLGLLRSHHPEITQVKAKIRVPTPKSKGGNGKIKSHAVLAAAQVGSRVHISMRAKNGGSPESTGSVRGPKRVLVLKGINLRYNN